MFGDLRAKIYGQIDKPTGNTPVHIPNPRCQSLGVAPSGMFMWIYASMFHFVFRQGGGVAARDLVMFLYFLFLSGKILDENGFNFTSTT